MAAGHPRFVLHFTPTSSSWLNLVERWFAELTNKKLRRGTHRSVRDPNTDIRAWIQTWNDNPLPYVWTKTADEILDSIATYCTRINRITTRVRQRQCVCAWQELGDRCQCAGRRPDRGRQTLWRRSLVTRRVRSLQSGRSRRSVRRDGRVGRSSRTSSRS